MMKPKFITGSLIVAALSLALIGCSPQIVTVTVVITTTPQPTQPATPTALPSATVAATANPTPTTAAATASPQATAAASTPTPTLAATANVPVFDYCGARKDLTLCITSLGLNPDNTVYMIFRYLNNDKSEKYYLKFDNARYDCNQINNLPDLYICIGLPYNMNRTVNVQLLKTAGDALVASGSIFLNQAYLYTYTPTPTNTPTPTITLTPSLTFTPTPTPTPTP